MNFSNPYAGPPWWALVFILGVPLGLLLGWAALDASRCIAWEDDPSGVLVCTGASIYQTCRPKQVCTEWEE